MPSRSKLGFTLLEVIAFVVVSSVALGGVLGLYQQAVFKSSEVIVSKQALEAAQALLEEVQAMPWTYCDPNDPAVSTANSSADCSIPQGLTPAAGKTRGGSNPFANVGDYGGYQEAPPTDIAGNTMPALSGYRITVSLTPVALGDVPSAEALRIDVSVSGPSGSQLLTGYKTRSSPNALP